MKLFLLPVLTLAVFVYSSSQSIHGQRVGPQPNISCPDCDDPPPPPPDDPPTDPGGGGSGPTTHPLYIPNPTFNGSYSLNFTGINTVGVGMGGVMRREAPAATYDGSILTMAWVSRQGGTDATYRPGPVITQQYDGSYGFGSATNTGIPSAGNPALTTAMDPDNPGQMTAFMAANFNGTTQVYKRSLSNGGWSAFGPNLSLNASYSPSLASYNGTLFLAIRNGGSLQNTIVQMSLSNPYSYNLQTFGNQVSFNAGLAVQMVGGTPYLYVGYADFGAHELRMYMANASNPQNPLSFFESNAISSTNNGQDDQSSTAPSLMTYNGALYIGFRTNDGDHKLLYRYTTDGTNWATRLPLSGNLLLGGTPWFVSGAPFSQNAYVFFSTRNNPDNDCGGCSGNNADDSKTHDLIIYSAHP